MTTEKKMNLDHRMAPLVGGVLVLFTAGTVFLTGALGFTDGGGVARNVLSAVGPNSDGAAALVLPSPRPSSPAGGTQLSAVADAATSPGGATLPLVGSTDRAGTPDLITASFGDPVRPAGDVALRTLGRAGSAPAAKALRTTARASQAHGGGDADEKASGGNGSKGKEKKDKNKKQAPPAHAKSKKPSQAPRAHAKSKKPSHSGPPAHAQNERAQSQGHGKGKAKKRG